ncbi:ComFC Predicted amidophosphoribosyltransferases [Candidatus Nanopelagicaceae bacterium]
MKSLRALQELIFPIRCLGCSALGLSICSECRRSWHPHIFRRTSKSKPHFPIYSAVQYSPIAGKVLLAAKENSLLQADALILHALKRSLFHCVQEQGIGLLIPIPSRPSVARLRGRQFVLELSQQLSDASKLPTFENLTHIRKVRDQSTLDSKARIENLMGSMRALRYLSGKAILVDDLVTTGSTLDEAARALREKGIEVAAAVTACVAEPLG